MSGCEIFFSGERDKATFTSLPKVPVTSGGYISTEVNLGEPVKAPIRLTHRAVGEGWCAGAWVP